MRSMVSSMSSKLSPRLHSLISLIEASRTTLWDIGCDHALLGLQAPEVCPWIKEVHLVDPSEAVFVNLKQLITTHIPKASFTMNLHNKNGENLTVSTANNVFVMAGMGGKTVMRILSHLKEVAGDHDQFIISPNRDILQVRAFLKENNWGLLGEALVEEEGLFYQQLSLTKMNTARSVSLYGEDFWQTPVGGRYKSHLVDKLSVHRDASTQAFVRFLCS